ncbi:retinol dehydrogenase 12-like [Hypomesus transpacificus]|uniref:retinol dehydrogenase 12-like n=1 Tax=Hypomesus transpacificus TaxID=137520 RepID=UPI001F0838BD|nr:retinol dehydrogenase 12-like [Hypomesus transpacificus]
MYKTVSTETRCRRLRQYVVILKLDLSDTKSIKEFAEVINWEESKLNLLINNAGGGQPRAGQAPTLGHYQGDANIMNNVKHFLEEISPFQDHQHHSIAHSWGNTNLDDIKREKGYNKNKAYSQSKLANILFTHLLAKRLEGHLYLSFIWYRCDCLLPPPGVVQTDLWRHLNPAQQAVMKMVSPFTKNSVQGAQTTIYCAVDPGLETKSGGYYSDCAPATCSRAATDDSVAQKLWDLSCQMLSISWD